MRDKVSTCRKHELSTSAKARIVSQLRRGDRQLIAELVGATPDYAKKVLAEDRADRSALARRIWLAANRLTISRNRLKGQLGA